MATTKPAAKKTAAPRVTAEERAAMKAYADERKVVAGRGGKTTKQDGEGDVQAAFAKMPSADRKLAEAIHAVVAAKAPELVPRTYYGMPAYTKDGNVLFWFKNASKFKMRYATLGFSDKASLDDGEMWPTEYALPAWSPAVEKKVATLITRAVG
jgi:uncharacterized protein YdhG (YjbR/CyaY superfamily)